MAARLRGGTPGAAAADAEGSLGSGGRARRPPGYYSSLAKGVPDPAPLGDEGDEGSADEENNPVAHRVEEEDDKGDEQADVPDQSDDAEAAPAAASSKKGEHDSVCVCVSES